MDAVIRSLFSRPKQSAVRGVHLYFSGESVIVAALHQTLDGVYYEQAMPLVMDGQPTPERLGAAFRSGFESFSVQDRNLRDVKRTDWPAFRASRLRSLEEFQDSFKPMPCFALNASNLIVQAVMQHPDHEGIELSVSMNPLLSPGDIGEKLLQLARVARAL